MLTGADGRSAPPPGHLIVGASRTRPTRWLPPVILPASLGLLVFSALSTNSLLAAASALLLLGSALLWRPGESPIFLFVFGYQWLQISAGIFYAWWLGVNIHDYSGSTQFKGDIYTAAILSMIGLLLVSCGMRLGAGPTRVKDADSARFMAAKFPTRDWFKLYVIACVIATLSQSSAWIIPGLRQPLLAVADLKWAFFFALTYSAFSSKGVRVYWLIAFAAELVLSLGSYFSDFKTVFFFSIFGIVAAQVRFSARVYIGMGILAALVLTMGVMWTAIKTDYRDFVNGKTREQVVNVDVPSRITKIVELASNVDEAAMRRSVERMIQRVAYLDFFGGVINYVPRVAPHEDGAIWLDAITRPFMPRLFFPEKAEIDDTATTTKYTGYHFEGLGGTSISIGYMGETYIDFGPFGMMPVLGLYGIFLGRIYRYFMKSPDARGMLGMGLTTAILYVVAPFETSITKGFGAIVLMVLVSWLLVHIVVPRWAPWLRASAQDALHDEADKLLQSSGVGQKEARPLAAKAMRPPTV